MLEVLVLIECAIHIEFYIVYHPLCGIVQQFGCYIWSVLLHKLERCTDIEQSLFNEVILVLAIRIRILHDTHNKVSYILLDRLNIENFSFRSPSVIPFCIKVSKEIVLTLCHPYSILFFNRICVYP